jgi:hypothetical protein
VNIFIRVKAAGKRRDMLELHSRYVPDDIETAEKLIEYIVRENVRAYNSKETDAPLFKYLSQKELEDGVHTGKVGFGDKKNAAHADEEDAVKNALQCFEDGIYRVLVNDTEAQSGGSLSLKEGDALTFLRLVMLAGRRW